MRKNGNNELNRGTKKSFVSVLPILGAGLLAGGAITGVALSAWQVSRSYKESAEFSRSADMKIKINPMAQEIDHGRRIDENLAKENTKLAAERLSAWLKYNGQDSYDVTYDLEKPEHPEKQDAQYFAYLTVKFKINKITSKLPDEEDKVENDPYLSVFSNSGFNTNNKSFVYRWYDDSHPETDPHPEYSILDFSDLFVLPEKVDETGTETKSMADKDSKNGIVYKINEKNADFLNKVYKDFLKYEAATKQTNKEINAKLQPRIYIINNLEGMINEASYHLANAGYSEYSGVESAHVNYLRVYKDSDYYKWAVEYSSKRWTGDTRSDKIGHLEEGTVRINDDETESIPNLDVLNRLDAKTPGTLEHSTIFSKYVEDIIPFGKIKDYFKENIDDDKIKNTIPTEASGDCKITYFWHPYTNKQTADNYLSNVVDKGWKKSKIVSIELKSDDVTTNYNTFITNYHSTIKEPKFTQTIFGNNLIGALSLGFLAFLIVLGIILGCLYRMTGVFSWICMMFMLSMTALLAVFGSGWVVSLSLLFGLFIMAIAGFITSLAICGRMKRRLQSNEDTQVIVSKTFKQSLWPAADTSIIALIFGVCFTYIAPLGLNALGLALIIGAFANFIGTYLFNGLLHALWFNNKLTINHYGWFGKRGNKANEILNQGRNELPITLDATKLEFQHYSKFCEKKINVTGKKSIIALSVVGALLIASIVLFVVLGVFNKEMFQQAENVVGSTNKDLLLYAMISTAAAAGISTLYAGIRCNWTAFVPMLAGAIGLPFIMLGIASAAQVKFDETVVLAYAAITVINELVCINVINTINAVWSRSEGYNKAELKFIVNEALKNNAFWLLLVAVAYAVLIIAFGLTSPIGCINLTALLIVGMGVTLIFAPFVCASLLYIFLVIRNAALRHKAKRKANKVVVNYDEIDEQSIEGLNKFSKKIPTPKEEPIAHEQK